MFVTPRFASATLGLLLITSFSSNGNPAGTHGRIGCSDSPKVVQRLSIDKPGVYENYRIDGRWIGKNLVKIKADGVTLRKCEILNGTHNGIVVYAKDVTIENCIIHHLLKGSFKDQQDAHGISGQPQGLTIRNCEIHHVSGDAVQFDPGRGPWGDVTIENCTFWTGPLAEDAAGFKKGERPGENAVDTKSLAENERAKVTVLNCLFHGWAQPGQIDNMAALNLKEHIDARIKNCVLYDNEISFRLRGGKGERGGARVTLIDCSVYRSDVAVRAEDGIENLKVVGLGVGEGVKVTMKRAGGGTGEGFEFSERRPPPLEEIIGGREK